MAKPEMLRALLLLVMLMPVAGEMGRRTSKPGVTGDRS